MLLEEWIIRILHTRSNEYWFGILEVMADHFFRQLCCTLTV